MDQKNIFNSLETIGFIRIPPLLDENLLSKFYILWSSLSKKWTEFIDLNNAHILIVFDSESKNLWPPKEGHMWPGYKQKTTKGNLIWKTESLFETSEGRFFKIDLQQTPPTAEYIFYPNEEFLKQNASLLDSYRKKRDEILKDVFPEHRATFCSLTYISGNSFLPGHTDGSKTLETSRIVQTIENTRQHSIVINDQPIHFKKGEAYLFNAFHKHELLPDSGYRLTLSSCIIKS